MCGITGAVSLKGSLGLTPTILEKMTSLLAHRGPNDRGTYLDGPVGFGHTRLSILDLSPKGHQPMLDRENHIILTFNGEIYNFREIRSELEKMGHSFVSDCDTEVIIYAYKEWGIACLEKLDGMFAFALHDKGNGKTFLVRDRLGVKPLFYATVKNSLVFGSEPKTILAFPGFKREVNAPALSCYLSYRYVLGEETLFKGMHTVLPGQYIEISHGKVTKRTYWDIPRKSIMPHTERYYLKKTRELVTKAIEKRLISDVPLGAYLSGGLDSSIVVAVMAELKKEPVKTFSIAFAEKGYNELDYARQVADRYKTDHHEITVSTKQYLDTMKELIKFKDYPLGVPNEVPLYLMSKELKKYITVVLSGEGADEMFSGYGRIFRSPDDYWKLKAASLLPARLRNHVFGDVLSYYDGKKFNHKIDHFLHQYTYFPLAEKNSLFTRSMKEATHNDAAVREIFASGFAKRKGSYHDKIAYVFEKLHLPGLLARLDITTMATAVEAREPFVDHELISFALSVPRRHKLRWKSFGMRLRSWNKSAKTISEHYDIPKHILREAFKNDLPPEILTRKKQGFPVPLDLWFKGDFMEYAHAVLLGKNAKIKGYIDQPKLRDWMNDPARKADSSFGQKVWMLINIEYWLQEYF